MTVKGKGFATFSRALKDLKKVPDNIAEKMERDIHDDLQRKYDQGRDPYGKKWTKRKGKYPWPIMRKTGKLKRSLKVKRKGSFIVAQRSGSGVQYHQSGTKHMAQRLVIPINKLGLPDSWKKIYKKRTVQAFRKAFR